MEILDGVCRHSDYDVSINTNMSCDLSHDCPYNIQCHRILENNEEELEVWWFKL